MSDAKEGPTSGPGLVNPFGGPGVSIINCPGCSRRLNLPAEVIGRELKCPGCATVFTAQETRDAGASVLSVRRDGQDEPVGHDRPAGSPAGGGAWRVGDRVLA